MPVFVNINGEWTKVSTAKIKVDGSWVDLTNFMVNVSGTWMSVWEASSTHVRNYYIVQPTDNAEAINDAINQTDEPMTIVFGAGEWTLTSPIIITRSDVTIQGVPNLTKLIRGFNGVELREEDFGFIRIIGTESSRIFNINIMGLIIDGNKNEYIGSGMVAFYVGDNSETPASELLPKQYHAKSGLTIEQCVFTNIQGESFICVFVLNTKIANNFFDYNDTSTLIIVESNFFHVYENTINIRSMYSMNIMDNDNFTVTKNIINYYSTEDHINIQGCNSFTISDNIITANSELDISSNLELSMCENAIITGNYLQSGLGHGLEVIDCNFNVIACNNFKDFTGNAIRLYMSSNNSITGNAIGYSVLSGLRLTGRSNDNIIASNFFVGNAETILDESSGNLIIHNTSN